MADLNGARTSIIVDATGNPISVATDASVQAVRSAVLAVTTAIQAQTELTALFVTDTTTGKYYIRREVVNEGTGVITVVFLNVDGTTPGTSPSVANLVPGNAGGTIAPVLAYFDVLTAGTGYAVDDQIARVLFLNTSTNAVAATAWYNLTQGTAISAPTAANIRQQDQNTVVSGTVTASLDGADPGSPIQANAGTGSRGWLATIAGKLVRGALLKASSLSVTVATDQGNLEPGGTAVTAATMPAGGIGLTGWLSAIYYAVYGRSNLFTPAQISAALAAGAQIASPDRDMGSAVPAPFVKYRAFVRSNQVGTLTIYGKALPGANPYETIYTAQIPANTPTFVEIPAILRVFSVAFVCGATASTSVTLADGFTSA